jgi:hypothetical protein
LCAFADTPNKAVIRRAWNFPILAARRDALQRPLAYFGLCGPEIRDLLDWRELLGVRTCLESPGRTAAQRRAAAATMAQMRTNVQAHRLGSGWQLLVADVETVLIEGMDINGTPPQLNDGRAVQLAHFRYELYNLDFDGGLGYEKEGGADRVNALRRLFERQQGTSFTLLLTLNVRSKLGNALENYLQGLRQREYGDGFRDLVDWYLARGEGEHAYRLKAIVPSFIHAASEIHGFRCRTKPPIVYDGHQKAKMVHFAFDLDYLPGELRAFSEQDERTLIQLPMLESTQGRIIFAAQQCPGFDPASAIQALSFLADETRDAIAATLPEAG